MPRIALNVFPLASSEFSFLLYRLPNSDGSRPSVAEEHPVRRSLCVDGIRDDYWTLFQKVENAVPTVCRAMDNRYATIEALRLALFSSCQQTLNVNDFRLVGRFRRSLEVVVGRYPEGEQVISLEPYFLPALKRFGILADFRFHPVPEHLGTRRALQLSLSVDRNGQPNKNLYADRYSQLSQFFRNFHSSIFPLSLPGGDTVDIDARLTEVSSDKLDVKHYIVGAETDSRSQFMGVKENGPLAEVPTQSHLCFLYRPEDRSLSHDLFRALRGDTFRTFPGMEIMFRVPLRREFVSGIPIPEFSYSEIDRISERIQQDHPSTVVPIVLTPFSRHDDLEDNSQYWYLKHAFLTRDLPIQVVATETVANKTTLKWSTAGIGLQVFAKAGGIPWKVRPRTERCLIVGVGQAHHVTTDGIERYFAYSVLTDSSGVFEEVRTLGEGRDEAHYIQALSDNLRNIFEEYSARFSNFVVHTTFTIRRKELDTISHILREQQTDRADGDFVAIKFNDRHRFFGFAPEHNSKVPYESSFLRLSPTEFLVWFEGLQYGQPTVQKVVSNPLHVEFIFPREPLSPDRQRAFLQDAINLSGANWRGFNAKSQPVSVYYAQIIAKYLKEFEAHNLPPIDIHTLKPWFL